MAHCSKASSRLSPPDLLGQGHLNDNFKLCVLIHNLIMLQHWLKYISKYCENRHFCMVILFAWWKCSQIIMISYAKFNSILAISDKITLINAQWKMLLLQVCEWNILDSYSFNLEEFWFFLFFQTLYLFFLQRIHACNLKEMKIILLINRVLAYFNLFGWFISIQKRLRFVKVI